MAGAIDPTGEREDALDAFLETKLGEGFEIETHTDTHAIVSEPVRRLLLLVPVLAALAAGCGGGGGAEPVERRAETGGFATAAQRLWRPAAERLAAGDL